jgi:hypothetical protein
MARLALGPTDLAVKRKKFDRLLERRSRGGIDLLLAQVMARPALGLEEGDAKGSGLRVAG